MSRSELSARRSLAAAIIEAEDRILTLWRPFGVLAARVACLLGWLLACTIGCSPYVVLNVQDPQGFASGAAALAVGDDVERLEQRALDDVALPVSVTLTATTAGERDLWVEALSADGVVLARGAVRAHLTERNLPLIVRLGRPCEGDDFVGGSDDLDARCDDGLFCNGGERCVSRVCEGGPIPCPLSPFACVDVVCLEDAEACGVGVHHDRCGDAAPICDPGAGCVRGPACSTDEDCDDAQQCNGAERCDGRTCAPGEPPREDDASPCTTGACIEGVGAVQSADNERQPCPLPGAPDDLGMCLGGLCGLPDGGASCATNDDCDDGLVCNGDEACLALRCFAGAAPALADGNPCTLDSCAEPGGAVHVAVADFTPCPLWPAPGGLGLCFHGLCTHPRALDVPDAGPGDDVPAVPSPVSATSTSSTSIELAWGRADGATGYDAQLRVVGATAWTAVDLDDAVYTPVAATMLVNGLVTDTPYELEVRATNAVGASAWSETVTGTPRANVPGAPTGVVATSGQDSQVPVSWNAVADAVDYVVQLRATGDAAFTSVVSASTATILTGLTNGVSIDVQVRARSSGGTSSPSPIVTATPQPIAPATPTGLAATSGQDTQVPVSWAAVSGATSYTLQHRVNGIGSFVQTAVAGTSTTITGLTNDTTYEFQVRANNTGGSSAFTSSITATPRPPAPSVPSGLAATSGQSTQVPVSWTAVSGATGYTLQHRVNGIGSFVQTAVVGTSTTITGLTNDTTYEFQVRANNTGGSSAFSTSVTATPRPPAPAVPTGLAATSGQDSQVPVSWTAVSGATGYTLQHRVNGVGSFVQTAVASTSTTVTGLTNATTYEFQVRANNTGGSSAFTASVTATPAAPAPPFHVNSAGNVNTAAASTISQSLPGNVPVGDTIVVAVSWDTTSTTTATCSDNRGNTYTLVESRVRVSSVQAAAVCIAPVTTGGSITVTVTFGAASGFRRLGVHQYRNVRAVAPVDAFTSNDVGNPSTAADAITSGTITTTVSNTLVFGVVENTNGGGTSMTPGTGFSGRLSMGSAEMVTEDRVLAAPGPIAATWTIGATGHSYIAIVVALKP